MNNKDVIGIMTSMAVLIEGLSHELVNKIATLQMKQQGMAKVVPVLMQGYKAAVQNKLIPEQLSKRILEGVGDLTDLNEQLIPMLEVLDRMNQYMDALSTSQNALEHSIGQSISHVLAQEHFNADDHAQKIQVMANDFFITVPKIFVEAAMSHVLHHLLYLASAEVVDVHLSAEQHTVTIIGHRVIAQQTNTPIFERSIYELYNKSYPGLGLCRMAFHLFGGDIVFKQTDERTIEYLMLFDTKR